ncbi:MAG: response regulator [Desulfomonilaceae bacterium]
MNPKILIVDDEERFRVTMSKLLGAEGLDARTAGSAAEALKTLASEAFDVVILDVRMPEMSGVEALKKIKEIDPYLEVIIMTGYASVDTAREIMSTGAFDYLLKPYSIETLLEKIEAAFDRRLSRIHLTQNS